MRRSGERGVSHSCAVLCCAVWKVGYMYEINKEMSSYIIII